MLGLGLGTFQPPELWKISGQQICKIRSLFTNYRVLPLTLEPRNQEFCGYRYRQGLKERVWPRTPSLWPGTSGKHTPPLGLLPMMKLLLHSHQISEIPTADKDWPLYKRGDEKTSLPFRTQQNTGRCTHTHRLLELIPHPRLQPISRQPQGNPQGSLHPDLPSVSCSPPQQLSYSFTRLSEKAQSRGE